MASKPCLLRGGPMDGKMGTLLVERDYLTFGTEMEHRCYVYRRVDTPPGAAVVFQFDGKESERRLRERGLVNDGQVGVA